MALRLDAPRSLRLGERDVPLELRRHPQARRITLRLTPEGDGVRLVLPNRTPIHEAVAFAERNSGWILKHLAKVPERIPFAAGAVIPLLGENHVITHDPAARGRVVSDDMVLAQQRDHRAGGEGDALGHLGQVLQDPAAVALGEGDGLVDRGAVGQDQAHAVALGGQPQGNAPGLRVAPEFQRHVPLPEPQAARRIQSESHGFSISRRLQRGQGPGTGNAGWRCASEPC